MLHTPWPYYTVNQKTKSSLNIPPHLNCVVTLPCEISTKLPCSMTECSKLRCKTQSLKKSCRKVLVSLIFVNNKVKIICVVTWQKQKQFLFVIGKSSGQFFIFKQDHCKANRAINPFACNFAKILNLFSLPNLAINT